MAISEVSIQKIVAATSATPWAQWAQSQMRRPVARYSAAANIYSSASQAGYNYQPRGPASALPSNSERGQQGGKHVMPPDWRPNGGQAVPVVESIRNNLFAFQIEQIGTPYHNNPQRIAKDWSEANPDAAVTAEEVEAAIAEVRKIRSPYPSQPLTNIPPYTAGVDSIQERLSRHSRCSESQKEQAVERVMRYQKLGHYMPFDEALAEVRRSAPLPGAPKQRAAEPTSYSRSRAADLARYARTGSAAYQAATLEAATNSLESENRTLRSRIGQLSKANEVDTEKAVARAMHYQRQGVSKTFDECLAEVRASR